MALGIAERLYDPGTHYEIVESAGIDDGRFHIPRHDRVGMFWYPPMAALLYAPFGALPLARADPRAHRKSWK